SGPGYDARPRESCVPRSSGGPGRRPLTAVTPVQIRYGVRPGADVPGHRLLFVLMATEYRQGMTSDTPPRITVGAFDADEADLALRWAARHAQQVGGRHHLLHAFVWTAVEVNTDPIPGLSGCVIRAASGRLIQDAVALARAEHPELPITSEIIDGNAVPVLVEASAESDLIVVGGRGLGRLLTLIVGSKSLALAARSQCPVVV